MSPARTDTAAKRSRPQSPYMKWLRRLLAAALLFVLVTGAVAYYVSWHLIYPARMPITKTPTAYGLKYHSIHFPSRIDHLRLSGWLLPPATPSDKIVIQAHGYRQNRSADAPALPMAAALHHAGYAVLMFDFRGEGRSAGHEVTVGLFEQRDLLGAIDYARSLGYRRIGLIGYSMGATTSLEVAAKEAAVGAVVADSPIANFYRYLQVHMPHWTHLPDWPFTAETLWEMREFNDLNAHLIDPERSLGDFGQRPVLLIAGTADTTVPMSNSQALAQALKHDRNASLWLVHGAKHVGAYTTEPQQYTRRVVDFFNRYL